MNVVKEEEERRPNRAGSGRSKPPLSRERIAFEKKRASSSTDWERRKQLDRQREKARREQRRNKQKNTAPATCYVPAKRDAIAGKPSSKDGQDRGGLLKLENRAQVEEMESFLEKKRHTGDDGNLRNYETKESVAAGQRILGNKPTIEDIRKVTFKQSNKFRIGEVVIVPRTRGGFSYAKITKQTIRNQCYLDPTKSIRYREWRTVYPNFKDKPLYKDLPSVFIGKLDPGRSESPRVASEPNEGADGVDEDDDDDALEGETIMFSGMGRVVVSTEQEDKGPSQLDVIPAGSEEPVTVEDLTERRVAARVWETDMDNVVFAPHSTFATGEIVVVPRSAGGFTYGMVQSSWNCPCPLGEGHKHSGWRVIIDDTITPRVVKDLLSVNIGKLHLVGARPSGLPSTLPNEEPNKVAIEPSLPKMPLPPFRVSPPGADRSTSPPDGIFEFSDVTSEEELRRAERAADISMQKQQHPVCTGAAVPSQPAVETETLPLDPFAGLFPSAAGGKISRAGIISVPNAPGGLKGIGDSTEKKIRSGNNDGHNARPRRKGGSKKNRGNKADRKPVIVLDGPNIAMKHGKQKTFSVRGIQIAANYYLRKGFDVISFLPQHYATKKPPSGSFKLQEFLPMADNLPLLEELVEAGTVVLTPAQDYDDSYCLEYAKRHSACIVSNDRYRDHIDKQSEQAKARVRKWVREHIISYTFVRDEFLPNPDFVFPEHPASGDSSASTTAQDAPGETDTIAHEGLGNT